MTTKKQKLNADERKFRLDRRNEYQRKLNRTKIKPACVYKVVTALLTFYSPENDCVFPGMEKICEESGLSVGGVQLGLRLAVKMKLIERKRRMGTSTITTFNWNFTKEDVEKGKPDSAYYEKVRKITKSRTISALIVDNQCTNEPNNECTNSSPISTLITNIREEHKSSNIIDSIMTDEHQLSMDGTKDDSVDIDSIVNNLSKPKPVISIRDYKARYGT